MEMEMKMNIFIRYKYIKKLTDDLYDQYSFQLMIVNLSNSVLFKLRKKGKIEEVLVIYLY